MCYTSTTKLKEQINSNNTTTVDSGNVAYNNNNEKLLILKKKYVVSLQQKHISARETEDVTVNNNGGRTKFTIKAVHLSSTLCLLIDDTEDVKYHGSNTSRDMGD